MIEVIINRWFTPMEFAYMAYLSYLQHMLIFIADMSFSPPVMASTVHEYTHTIKSIFSLSIKEHNVSAALFSVFIPFTENFWLFNSETILDFLRTTNFMHDIYNLISYEVTNTFVFSLNRIFYLSFIFSVGFGFSHLSLRLQLRRKISFRMIMICIKKCTNL